MNQFLTTILGIIPMFVVLCAVASPNALVLNVADFGAVPDDDSDDTAAFEQALNRAAEGPISTVHVPAGRYLITNGRLKPQSGVTLAGEGRSRTLLQSASRGEPDAMLTPEGEDITIRDLAMRGRDEGVPPNYSAAGMLIRLRRARHICVERCNFEKFSSAVQGATDEGGFYTVSDVEVSDCRFRNGALGVACQACERIAVYRCQFEDLSWATATSRCLGSRFMNNDVRRCVTGIRGLHAFDVHVCHNTFREIGSNGAVQFDTAIGGEISHNLVDNQNAVAEGTGGWNLEVEAASGIIIQGNVIRASQHQDQIGIFLHGRFGGWTDWGIDPFSEERADKPEYETSFIEGAPEEVAKWTVAQPDAVEVSSDAEVRWREQPSFRIQVQPAAQPGVLAWRPFTEDQQHKVYGDMIVGYVAVRGNTAPPKALGLALCLEGEGQRPAQTLLVPGVSKRFAEDWYTYRCVVYETGAGFGMAPQFAPFQSIAVVLLEPLEEAVDVRIGTFRRAFAWQSNRDLGTVVTDNTISNAAHGIVMSQLLKNVTITNNVIEANQSRLNRGNMAIQMLTWHAVARDPAKVYDRNNLPPEAPPDWVPDTDPLATLPDAQFYENCRISGNLIDGYQQFVGVAGVEDGRFILQEQRLGLMIENNQLQRVASFLPEGFPQCVSVRGNTRDNYPTSGTVTLGSEPLTVENPNFTDTCAVRLSPLSQEAFGHQPRITELGGGKLTVDPAGAPVGAVFAWEIYSDHLPR